MVVLTSLSSAWFGFKQGAKYSSASEYLALAAISTAQVNRLKSGNKEDINNVVSLFDIYINHGVDQFYWYSENGNKYIGDLFYTGYESSMVDSIKIIASHRSRDPEIDVSSSLSGEVKDSYVDGYIIRKSVIGVISGK